MKHYKDSKGNFYGRDDGYTESDWVEVTIEEINQANAIKAQAEFDALPYYQKRAAEYPDFKDYLDGVVKGDQAQIDDYIAKCLEVKAKYPKQ